LREQTFRRKRYRRPPRVVIHPNFVVASDGGKAIYQFVKSLGPVVVPPAPNAVEPWRSVLSDRCQLQARERGLH
jgi:hypothetical protein